MAKSFTYVVTPNVRGRRCSLEESIIVAPIILEKVQQESESWGKRLRFLDSFALPFHRILIIVPTWRFLGFIFIRNVAFPYISDNQVLWLLGEFREFLAVILSPGQP